MRILFIGDIVARVGRKTTASLLPDLIDRHDVDFTIANCENAAGGIGVTKKIGEELLGLGIDALTSGNHIWDKRDAMELLEQSDRVVRPGNYPPGAIGRGLTVVPSRRGLPVGVVNLQGRVFMQQIDCPFRVGDELVASALQQTPIVIVDVHAEATSEKLALGWHLAGRATAVLGTHTHVQTADERVLENHTAYITDVGMTGPYDSVIGIKKEISIARFITQLPQRFEAADGSGMLNAVVIDVDDERGAARSIERIMIRDGREMGTADRS